MPISQSPKIEEAVKNSTEAAQINENAMEQTTSEHTSAVAETPKSERNKKRTERVVTINFQ